VKNYKEVLKKAVQLADEETNLDKGTESNRRPKHTREPTLIELLTNEGINNTYITYRKLIDLILASSLPLGMVVFIGGLIFPVKLVGLFFVWLGLTLVILGGAFLIIVKTIFSKQNRRASSRSLQTPSYFR